MNSGEDDGEKTKPWEECNGYYSILSRLVKNFPSTFIWTVKSSTIDFNYLSKDQMFNHYNKNGALTTKVSLSFEAGLFQSPKVNANRSDP